MNRTNIVVAGCFLALGAYLAVSSLWLPPGLHGLPGPGFFPRVIGILMIMLSIVLATSALRSVSATPFKLDIKPSLAGTVGLAFIYLLLWGTGGFPVRTAIFLAFLLRLFGERWRISLIVGAALATAITLGFQFGLRLTME